MFGYFALPSHCFDIRKWWWFTFSWDECCFTLFTYPKRVDSPQVEEIVHIGLQGYFQFRFPYTSERSANVEDTLKCMQVSKLGKTILCQQPSSLSVVFTTKKTNTIQKLQVRKANIVFTNNWELQHFTWGLVFTLSEKVWGLCSCTTLSPSTVVWCKWSLYVHFVAYFIT